MEPSADGQYFMQYMPNSWNHRVDGGVAEITGTQRMTDHGFCHFFIYRYSNGWCRGMILTQNAMYALKLTSTDAALLWLKATGLDPISGEYVPKEKRADLGPWKQSAAE